MVNPTRLFEMLKGSKYGHAQKSVTKGTLILDINAEADAATKLTEQALQQARHMTKKSEPAMCGAEADQAGETQKSEEKTPTMAT